MAGERRPPCPAPTFKAPAEDAPGAAPPPPGTGVPCRTRTRTRAHSRSRLRGPSASNPFRRQTVQGVFARLWGRGFSLTHWFPMDQGDPTQFSRELPQDRRVSKPRVWGEGTEVGSPDLIREPGLWAECCEDGWEDEDGGVLLMRRWGTWSGASPFSSGLALREPLRHLGVQACLGLVPKIRTNLLYNLRIGAPLFMKSDPEMTRDRLGPP